MIQVQKDPAPTAAIERLRLWLVDDALPLWSVHGVDRIAGGFHEKLRFDLTPIDEMRRARLVSRQIYSFALGHEMGWRGPARQLVKHGLDFLTTRLLRPDGTVLMASSPDGRTVKADFDPYDYAFVLFGLAAAARKLAERSEMEALARRVRSPLLGTWSHPLGGFEQSLPRSLPLRANPQMHLFEAFLAWAELAGGDDPVWDELADAMARLALDRLIMAETGALPEHFDGNWLPVPDSRDLLVEPGHQFEWSWLLARWSQLRGDRPAFAAAARLAAIGERFGLDDDGVFVINELDGQLRRRDGGARLWPQAERAKAWHALAAHPMQSPAGREQALRRLDRAAIALESFLVDRPKGLWREVRTTTGEFVVEPVRASSLYHLTCAVHVISADVVQVESVS